ncbi:MAG: ankyrin repeat domain-containing protein [Candidatus Wallbacteria bacterium]|nr:ankyrin repeat domain-containing protein [Candidatus Wallbacteria bacterium]
MKSSTLNGLLVFLSLSCIFSPLCCAAGYGPVYISIKPGVNAIHGYFYLSCDQQEVFDRFRPSEKIMPIKTPDGKVKLLGKPSYRFYLPAGFTYEIEFPSMIESIKPANVVFNLASIGKTVEVEYKEDTALKNAPKRNLTVVIKPEEIAHLVTWHFADMAPMVALGTNRTLPLPAGLKYRIEFSDLLGWKTPKRIEDEIRDKDVNISVEYLKDDASVKKLEGKIDELIIKHSDRTSKEVMQVVKTLVLAAPTMSLSSPFGGGQVNEQDVQLFAENFWTALAFCLDVMQLEGIPPMAVMFLNPFAQKVPANGVKPVFDYIMDSKKDLKTRYAVLEHVTRNSEADAVAPFLLKMTEKTSDPKLRSAAGFALWVNDFFVGYSTCTESLRIKKRLLEVLNDKNDELYNHLLRLASKESMQRYLKFIATDTRFSAADKALALSLIPQQEKEEMGKSDETKARELIEKIESVVSMLEKSRENIGDDFRGTLGSIKELAKFDMEKAADFLARSLDLNGECYDKRYIVYDTYDIKNTAIIDKLFSYLVSEDRGSDIWRGAITSLTEHPDESTSRRLRDVLASTTDDMKWCHLAGHIIKCGDQELTPIIKERLKLTTDLSVEQICRQYFKKLNSGGKTADAFRGSDATAKPPVAQSESVDDDPARVSFLSAIDLGDLGRVKALAKKGVDSNARDRLGRVPVSRAILNTRYEIAEWLLQNGADCSLESTDSPGFSILMQSCESGCDKLLAILLKKGADPNKKYPHFGAALLCVADRNEDERKLILKALLKYGANPDYEDNSYTTPLIAACDDKILENVQALLRAGADPNRKNRDHDTPLIVAIKSCFGDTAVIEALLEKRANPNLAGEFGITPLMVAAKMDEWIGKKVVPLLLEKGADQKAADIDGWTALDYAQKAGNPEIWNMIDLHVPPDAEKQDVDAAAQRAAGYGSVTISIGPAKAINAGARWKFKGEGFWRFKQDGGMHKSGSTAEIEFRNVYGWIAPNSIKCTIENSLVEIVKEYQYNCSNLTAFILPEDAIHDCAEWRVVGEKEWHQSGDFVPVTKGSFEVEYKEISGWTTPAKRKGTLKDEAMELKPVVYQPIYYNFTVIALNREQLPENAKWKLENEQSWHSLGEKVPLRFGDELKLQFTEVPGYKVRVYSAVEFMSSEDKTVQVKYIKDE